MLAKGERSQQVLSIFFILSYSFSFVYGLTNAAAGYNQKNGTIIMRKSSFF